MSPAAPQTAHDQDWEKRVTNAVVARISDLRLGVDRSALFSEDPSWKIALVNEQHRIACSQPIPGSILGEQCAIPEDLAARELLSQEIDARLAAVPITVTALILGLTLRSAPATQLSHLPGWYSLPHEFQASQVTLQVQAADPLLTLTHFLLLHVFCPSV